jgi:thymidylate synthase (FAD)
MISVELIDHMGNDATVVNAARVSFEKDAANFSDEQNAKLIAYLAKHDHFTPFTHPQITLRETVPIFVARQRTKHTIGFSYNEISKRYVSDTPEFFIPKTWRSKPEGSIKQGSGGTHENDKYWDIQYTLMLAQCKKMYESMIKDGIAPEQARMVLPQSMLTSYYVTGSLAAFARAYKLRIDSHAQEEIQDLAVLWDKTIAPLFPVSWKVLTNQ